MLARPLASRVFFAGEAVADEFSGDVHGAWLSGINTALDVVATVRGKTIAAPDSQ